jgi:plasmid segregation protein ParM
MAEKKGFKLVAGVDGGNTKTKVSFLSKKGNITSFALPTVIAPADSKGDPFKDSGNRRELSDIDRLHVHIQSKSLPRTYYFVGDWARDKVDMLQPEEVKDKHDSELHIVTTLTGLALAVLKEGETEASLSYSGGLPIEERKRIDEAQVLAKLIGDHVIEFLDGKFAGKRVTLHVYNGKIHVEGITSSLGLKYSIVKNEVVALEHGSEIGEEYALGDLGAGTLDLALYDEDGLNGYVSTNKPLGTNVYIDRMIEEIFNKVEFEDVKKFLKEQGKELQKYRNREEFVSEVIVPGVKNIIAGEAPLFTVSWARMQNVDVTPIVLKHMKEYYDKVYSELELFWLEKAPKIKTFLLVGGGVLFAFVHFKDLKNYVLPPKEILEDSAFFTSRAYLIANYVEDANN